MILSKEQIDLWLDKGPTYTTNRQVWESHEDLRRLVKRLIERVGLPEYAVELEKARLELGLWNL